MSQLILFVAIDLLGVAVCMAVGPWRRLWLCCALGFVVGLACVVFLSLGVLLLGAFNIGVMFALYVALLATCIGWSVKRRRWNLDTVLTVACGVLGFAVLCLPFCDYNFSSFSYDSHQFVMYGRALGKDGVLSLEMLERLNAWGVFLVVAHALGAFVSVDYLYGLAPAFAISMLSTFAAMLDDGLEELRVPRWYRVLWIGLALAVVLAIPIVRFHVVYIHANMPASGVLLCFVGMFWLAQLKNDVTYTPIAFLSLLSFTLMRVEAASYAMIFLGLTVMDCRLSRRAVFPWYLLYTIVVVAWLALLALNAPDGSLYLTPTKCVAFAALLASAFAYWLIKDRWLFRYLTPYVPHLLVVLCALGISYGAMTHGETMRLSVKHWLGDLWSSPWWASIWQITAVLAVVSVFVPAPPYRKPLVLGIWLFFGLTLIIAATGTVFNPGHDGSLIRMTIHIVPVVIFYGVLKFAPLLVSTRER